MKRKAIANQIECHCRNLLSKNKNQVKFSVLALKLFIKLESTYPMHTKKDIKKT